MSVLHASMPAAPLVALEYSGVELYPHDRHQLRHAHFLLCGACGVRCFSISVGFLKANGLFPVSDCLPCI
jgi:hypothetical protein